MHFHQKKSKTQAKHQKKSGKLFSTTRLNLDFKHEVRWTRGFSHQKKSKTSKNGETRRRRVYAS